MAQALHSWAVSRGYRLAAGETALLTEVRDELDSRLVRGELAGQVHSAYAGALDFSHERVLPSPRSVVVIAVPRPAYRLKLAFAGTTVSYLIPPTYVGYRNLQKEVRQDLQTSVLGQSTVVADLHAPLKLLAARLGLVSFGRNNITYVEGLGSYFQLVGFVADADLGPPVPARATNEAKAHRCTGCDLCRRACPTGAIGEERFLIHAERCLTFYSEHESPWPNWIPASAHRWLIGCLSCQLVCPMNHGSLQVEALPVSFDQEETARLLGGGPAESDPVWKRVEAKMHAVDLLASPAVVGRNLRAMREAGL